jgi:hypothetical protein
MTFEVPSAMWSMAGIIYGLVLITATLLEATSHNNSAPTPHTEFFGLL